MTDAAFVHRDHTLQWIRVKDLKVIWPEAQRGLNERRAKEIAEAFDPDAFGTLTIGRLPTGENHICDGQTRAAAVAILFGDEERAPCTVVPCKDKKDAARIYRLQNGGRTKPSALSMFTTAVTEGKPEELAVTRIVQRAGMVIEARDADGVVRAVHALMAVRKLHGDKALAETLEMLQALWGKDHAAYDASMLRGAALYLAEGGAWTPAVVTKIQKKHFEARHFIGAARSTGQQFSCSMQRAVCLLFQQLAGARNAHKGDTSPRQAA